MIRTWKETNYAVEPVWIGAERSRQYRSVELCSPLWKVHSRGIMKVGLYQTLQVVGSLVRSSPYMPM